MFATPPLTVLSSPGDTSGACVPIGALGLGTLGMLDVLGALASASTEIGTDVRLVTPGLCAWWHPVTRIAASKNVRRMKGWLAGDVPHGHELERPCAGERR